MKRFTVLFTTVLLCLSSFGQMTITVDPATTYQTVVGMGGHGISTDANDMKYLIDFLGITAYRHWIEVEGAGAGKTYVTLANIASGAIPWKDVTATSQSFFKTLKDNNIKVIATCWSPPACLKQNNCVQQIGSDGTCGGACVGAYNCPDPINVLLPEYYDEYARYLALWAKDFQTRNAISLYAVSIQNEPLFNEPYASAKLFSSAYGPALRAVHDTFAKYPELSGIKFFGPEHMSEYSRNYGGDGINSKYIQDVIDNATYKPYLDAYAVHGYSDGIAPNPGTSLDWTNFYNKIVVENNKMLWMSETSGEPQDWDGAWTYMNSIFSAYKSGHISLWTYWGMGGLYNAGSATRSFYNSLHYYRFIRGGMQMIKVSDSDDKIEAIGFKNGNDFTFVVINSSTTDTKTINFNSFTGLPAFFHQYRSTSIDQCAYVGKITNNTFVIPPKSVHTITYNAATPDVTYGPKAPASITASTIGDNSVTFTWPAVSSWTLKGSPITTSGYLIYVDGKLKTTNGPITSTSYTLTGLKPGTKYTIEIITRDAMRNQSIATSLEVTTTCSAGNCVVIPDALEDEFEKLSVSPNPASDVIRINNAAETVFSSVSIIDVAGKVMIEKANVPAEEGINVSSLSKGIYFIVAKGKNQSLTSKFVKE